MPRRYIGKQTRRSALRRYVYLISLLNLANYWYHVMDEPVIEDTDFDQKFRELKIIENRHPSFRSPVSPTRYVGYPTRGLPTHLELTRGVAMMEAHISLCKRILPVKQRGLGL